MNRPSEKMDHFWQKLGTIILDFGSPSPFLWVFHDSREIKLEGDYRGWKKRVFFLKSRSVELNFRGKQKTVQFYHHFEVWSKSAIFDDFHGFSMKIEDFPHGSTTKSPIFQ